MIEPEVAPEDEEAQRLETIKIAPGGCYVTAQQIVISTVLGSCVSACIHDPIAGIGGMNHFMLPGDVTVDHDIQHLREQALRYGTFAMDHLVELAVELGAARERLEVKLFGGASVLPEIQLHEVGAVNIEFARRYVETAGLRLVAEDLGGSEARKLNFFPREGRAMVRRLPTTSSAQIAELESIYEQQCSARMVKL